MARQEMLMARCDRKECHTVIEIDRATEAPKGWLQIAVEVEGKYDPRAKLEFCSEKCVSIWARNRGQIAKTNGNSIVPKEQVWEAIKLICSEKGEFTSSEIQSFTGLAQSTVDRWIRNGVDEGELTVLAESDGPNPRHLGLAA